MGSKATRRESPSTWYVEGLQLQIPCSLAEYFENRLYYTNRKQAVSHGRCVVSGYDPVEVAATCWGSCTHRIPSLRFESSEVVFPAPRVGTSNDPAAAAAAIGEVDGKGPGSVRHPESLPTRTPSSRTCNSPGATRGDDQGR